MTVKVFKGFQLFDECLVLVLQDGDAILQTLDVLLLLPATFSGRFSAERTQQDFSFGLIPHILTSALCSRMLSVKSALIRMY